MRARENYVILSRDEESLLKPTICISGILTNDYNPFDVSGKFTMIHIPNGYGSNYGFRETSPSVIVVINADADNTSSPRKRLREWSEDYSMLSTQRYNRLKNRTFIQKITGKNKEKYWPYPNLPDDLIVIAFNSVLAPYLMNSDIPILRRAYHNGVLGEKPFRDKFLEMLALRKQKNIKDIFSDLDHHSAMTTTNSIEEIALIKSQREEVDEDESEMIDWEDEFSKLGTQS